jgi:hypothetical protein
MRRHQLRSKVQHYLAPCLFHILHVFWMLLIELSDKSPSDKASTQSSKVRPFSKLKLLDPSKAIQGGGGPAIIAPLFWGPVLRETVLWGPVLW